MKKNKKILSAIMSVAFAIYVMLGSIPAIAVSIKAKLPVSTVTGVAKTYKLNTPVKISVTTKGFSLNVKYKVTLLNLGTNEATYVTKGYGSSVSPKRVVSYQVTPKKVGKYRLRVYVKRASSKLGYDSYVEKRFAVVKIIVSKVVVSPVSLGRAGNYVILAKSGISSVPNSVITGNIGVSPIGSTAITGFSLTVHATNQFSVSKQITGKAYASDYTTPTPINLTTAVNNMETAYTSAAGRAAKYTELYAGNISGKTLSAGVYKWSTGVLLNSNVTLHGGANDVWIFQIAKGMTEANGIKIILTGGAQAKNIFWQVANTVSIGTNAHLEGIVLSKKNIALGTKASINGRLFAQTAVTLKVSTVVAPPKQ